MALPDKTLDPLILACAKAEFLEKGYQKATLRGICDRAGVTTGALYKRYANKDELFAALIQPVIALFATGKSEAVQRSDDAIEAENLSPLLGSSEGYYKEWICQFYQHYDALKLLLCCANGSMYENYMHQYIEQMTDGTMLFVQGIAQMDGARPAPTREEVHILLTAWWECLLEPIKHDFTQEQALKFCTRIDQLFHWETVFLGEA